MKKILIAMSLFAVMLTACSAKGPANPDTTGGLTGKSTSTAETASGSTAVTEDKVSDYFPMNGDVYMKYKGTGNEYAEYETYVDYVKDNTMQIRKNNGGTELALVYVIKDGALINTYSRGETYYRYDYTVMSDKEDVLLKEPLAAGTSWTLKDGSTRSITAVDSQIETPAGSFKALEVTTKRKDSTEKDYYVKCTGLVKSIFSSGDASMTVTSELEKLEKDVAFKHTARFYFPQFEKDRIVYIEREVGLKTNQDMKWQFQKELKTITENAGLSATLTKNTKILGISLDDEKDTVTVDLSSDFVKEMNAGTSFEGMLLNSITNTFGDYYMKNKVIITLDGKPYESGHVLMNPGEAFDVKKDGIVQFK